MRRPPAPSPAGGAALPDLRQVAFALAALPAVGRAAVRARRALARGPVDAAVAELRAVPRFRAGWLGRPEWLDATVVRLLPVLPPLGCGPCLKRCLVDLDLWSRCGLTPRLHLGVRAAGAGEWQAHAWLTAVAADGTPLRVSSDLGHAEACEL